MHFSNINKVYLKHCFITLNTYFSYFNFPAKKFYVIYKNSDFIFSSGKYNYLKVAFGFEKSTYVRFLINPSIEYNKSPKYN